MNKNCIRCGDIYQLRGDCESTDYCDLCCQDIVFKLSQITPKPPKAITYEMGVEILNVLQKELYDNWNKNIRNCTCGDDCDSYFSRIMPMGNFCNKCGRPLTDTDGTN